MKKILFICLLAMGTLASCQSCSKEKTTDPAGGVNEPSQEPEVISEFLPLADPYVLTKDGVYYAYGTHSDSGIECYTSTDLKTWRYKSLALDKKDSYADRWFWAPEVYPVNGKYYMFYSADEHICMAIADAPEGPFRQSEKKPIWDEKSIDTSLFIDDNGIPYLFFVRFTNGNVIWVAEMTPDLTAIKEETLKQCVEVGEPWELAQDKPARVAEGPSIVKRDGVYYMLYSCNHFESIHYGVGYATATSPFGPWKKYEGNPILQGADGMHGTGHGAPFQALDGSWKYIYHAHWNTTTVQPRTSFVKDMAFSPQGVISISGEPIRPRVVE